jgi:hypothetical protein
MHSAWHLAIVLVMHWSTLGVTVGIEEKACMILESLSCHLSDGQVDYECLHGEHKFVITFRGKRFQVRFAEQRLLRKGVGELQAMVHEVVRKVRLNGGASSTALW